MTEQTQPKHITVDSETIAKVFEEHKAELQNAVDSIKSELSEFTKTQLVNEWIESAKTQLDKLTIFKPSVEQAEEVNTKQLETTQEGFNPNEFTLEDVETYLKKGI